MLFWCWWKLTPSTSLVNQWQTLSRPLLFVAGSSGSSLYLAPLQRCPHQRTVLSVFSNICNLLLLHNNNDSPVTPWWRTATKLLVVIFFNPCLSNLTNHLIYHHTFPLLPMPPRLALYLWGVRGLGGITILLWSWAIKEERPVELGWWGYGWERGGGSVWGTGKAVNTESSGPRGTQLRARLFLVRVTKTQ